ncbi:hypothetical protein C7U63_20100 [Aeromonas veronii]|nr:hypothetical protein C7U63_20100 [Aeromonas veronii]KRV92253.1 hypothetical protein AO718_11615 [Aeromonas veronii]KRV99658.1 hypothetical protein AO725_18960 [Aeromonas veronii]KRW10237.1 hypothetical protein AO745_17455 [Aeromonas veronii]KRW12342.1 hypothetical protein AO732_19265 [Aeromonas veronii]
MLRRVAVAALLFWGALGGMRGCFAIERRQIVYKMKSDDPHACWRIGLKREFMGEWAIFVKEWQQIHFI